MVSFSFLYIALFWFADCSGFSNVIGVEGAEHLASYVIQSNCIEELFLSSNIIADEGALAMSKVSASDGLIVRLVTSTNFLILFVLNYRPYSLPTA